MIKNNGNRLYSKEVLDARFARQQDIHRAKEHSKAVDEFKKEIISNSNTWTKVIVYGMTFLKFALIISSIILIIAGFAGYSHLLMPGGITFIVGIIFAIVSNVLEKRILRSQSAKQNRLAEHDNLFKPKE